VPLIGTPGEAYLRDIRKIDIAAIEDVLERTDAIGWHPNIYFHHPADPVRGTPAHPLHGRRIGCVVGVMTNAVTAHPTGAISRTYIAPDGTKVGKAKTLGSPAGVIRLSTDDEVLAGLHIAEGLETALTVMAKGFRPAWATGSTSLMKSFPVLAGVEALTVFADNDANGAGEKAAREAEARWLAAGREVKLYRRNTFGDINDAFADTSDAA
jgi:putative DNA primase/helicase